MGVSTIIIIGAAAVGFFISATIANKKRKKQKLICPVGYRCDTVIQSSYAKFLGIPLEFLGMTYYGGIALGYIALQLIQELLPTQLPAILLGFSIAAFFFSCYLLFVQAVQLREWCTWCIASAFCSTVILIVALTVAFSAAPAFLISIKPLLLGGHLLGVALGLGAATVSDLFFFRFLKDYKISHFEASVLRSLSDVIWFGLGLLVLTGLGLFLTAPDAYLASAKFITKMIIVGVIIVNGAFLNLYITPLLTAISFQKKHKHHDGELGRIRHHAFAMGAISAVSWYSAFVLGMFRSIPFTVYQALALYLAALVFGIVVSQMTLRSYMRRAGE
jgi:uncharacterized membrane protein